MKDYDTSKEILGYCCIGLWIALYVISLFTPIANLAMISGALIAFATWCFTTSGHRNGWKW